MSVKLAALINRLLGLGITYDGDRQRIVIERQIKKAAISR